MGITAPLCARVHILFSCLSTHCCIVDRGGSEAFPDQTCAMHMLARSARQNAPVTNQTQPRKANESGALMEKTFWYSRGYGRFFEPGACSQLAEGIEDGSYAFSSRLKSFLYPVQQMTVSASMTSPEVNSICRPPRNLRMPLIDNTALDRRLAMSVSEITGLATRTERAGSSPQAGSTFPNASVMICRAVLLYSLSANLGNSLLRIPCRLMNLYDMRLVAATPSRSRGIFQRSVSFRSSYIAIFR